RGADQVGQGKAVLQCNTGRGSHSESLCEFQEAPNAGRTRHTDALWRGNVFISQCIEPLGNGIHVGPELGDDHRQDALLRQTIELVAGLTEKVLVGTHRMSFGVSGDRNLFDPELWEYPRLDHV